MSSDAAAVEPLLTIAEVAQQLRLSRTTIYRRVADGTLPKPLKLGTLVRWEPADIRAARLSAAEKRKGL